MKRTQKEFMIDLLKGIIKAILLSFVIYIFTANFLAAIFYHDAPPGQRDFTPIYLSFIVIYSLAINFAYIRKESNEYYETDKKIFNWKQDVMEYLTTEGKYVILVYGILAIVMEIGYWIFINAIPNPVEMALMFCFPLAVVINIPIIRTILAYILTIFLHFLLTEWNHYRMHRYWEQGK